MGTCLPCINWSYCEPQPVFRKVEIINNDDNSSRFDLKRARNESYKKCNDNITDDSYQFDVFEQEYDGNKQYTEKIMKENTEYQKIKEEKRKKESVSSLHGLNELNELKDLKYRELDEDDKNLIDKIFELSSNEIIGHHKRSNIEVRIKDLNTLQHGQWLNDEIINFYMALLQDRNLKRIKENPLNTLKVLFMNTFFYTKLTSNNGYSYKSVKRWTKKAKLINKGYNNESSIFEFDKLIFPVHINNIHWCCGCINFKNKQFEFYDSMNGSSSIQFFKITRKYILDEFADKLKNDKTKYNLSLSEWNDNNNITKYPQQQNGVDCGVFTAKCADWISHDLYPDYSQQNMPYFRNRMMVEIIRGKILDF